MNKNGIAMAADSIVTLTTSNNTQRPLTQRTSCLPIENSSVAAMVSQNVSF
jgi:hypothetical protein